MTPQIFPDQREATGTATYCHRVFPVGSAVQDPQRVVDTLRPGLGWWHFIVWLVRKPVRFLCGWWSRLSIADFTIYLFSILKYLISPPSVLMGA